jgi:hypothetical protein
LFVAEEGLRAMPDDPPPPQKRQNIAAAGILIAVLGVLFMAFAALDVAALGGSLTGEHGIGRLFLLVVDTKIDSRITIAIGGILSVGGSYVAGGGLSNRWFAAIVTMSALTAAFCLLFLVLLSDDQLAQALYDYGSARVADDQSFHAAAAWILVELSVWLLGVVGMQLGVRTIKG